MRPAVERSISTVVAAVLAVAGLASLLAAFGQLSLWQGESADPQREAVLRTALRGAFFVIAIKCLIPQLILGSSLAALFEWLRRPWRARGVARAVLLWLACALAYAAVGPLLLSRPVAGLPAMEHANALQHLGTLAATSTGAAAALWLASRLVDRLRPAAREPGEPDVGPDAGDTARRQIG
ncbi:MAG: hypothetical protein ACQGVK_19800 [Myxococcota bacterium]